MSTTGAEQEPTGTPEAEPETAAYRQAQQARAAASNQAETEVSEITESPPEEMPTRDMNQP